MRKTLTAALAAFALAPAARAAETKYVVVDSQRVMRDCDECKAAIAAIQKDTDERGKQLEAKGKELEAAFADFDKQSAVLSAEQKQAKTDDLQKRRFEWNQAMMKFQEEVNAR